MKANRGYYRQSQENERYVQSTAQGTWHVKDWKITFGKHKGSLLKDVIKNDVDYMRWAIENIEGFASNLTDKMLRKCRCSASRGGFVGKCQKVDSKPSTVLGKSSKQAYSPSVQPPPEEERHFTPSEMHIDTSFDVDAANADDSIPFFHREDAPSNAFDHGGFLTKDRMDYHASMLNPTHEAFRQLGSHLDSVFEKHHGGAMEPDDDDPPW